MNYSKCTYKLIGVEVPLNYESRGCIGKLPPSQLLVYFNDSEYFTFA